ncbi:hypothetical protein ABZ569_23195 [Streptomyces albus]|uniref:hypothetical protein n=1 Tax=Streptomyces albus TaxID=1888 RepID=UPI0033ED46FA
MKSIRIAAVKSVTVALFAAGATLTVAAPAATWFATDSMTSVVADDGHWIAPPGDSGDALPAAARLSTDTVPGTDDDGHW